MAAVVAGSVGLVWANSRSSSSCEIDNFAHTEAMAPIDNESGNGSVDSSETADPGHLEGVVCNTAAVMPGSAAPQAATSEATSSSNEPGDVMPGDAVVDADEPVSTDQASADPASGNAAPADSAPANTAPDNSDPAPATPTSRSSDPAPATSTPATPTSPSSDPAPATSTPANPAPANPDPAPANYSDITTFGVFHGTSSHTHGDSLAGGRTAITTEALAAYNGLRAFHGLDAAEPEAIGQWAFANSLTNNREAYGEELKGVGLYYGMQGAKVGWIRDDAFDPQILANIQLSAREGETGAVMTMVEAFGHPGYADHLNRSGLVDAFVNTLKMEPHYGGWMHGRVHGGLPFSDGTGASVATAHDLNHLTVLSHDQRQPFMNDTFDWPQWPALDVPESDVIDYFQSMVVLGDPHSDALP